MRKQNLAWKTLVYLVLIAVSVVLLVPFMFMLTTALKETSSLLALPPEIMPKSFHWSNFIIALERMNFLLLLGNTAFITFMVIMGILISCSIVGYGFARLEFKGKSFWFFVLIGTMIAPDHITLIPLYVLMRSLNWIDTFYPLIVPAFFGAPFYIFLIRQFFMTIPKELDDAATIDGCGPFKIFTHIMLPLVKPALATVTIFVFMSKWNDFLGPLIYLQSDHLKTLSLGLYVFQGLQSTQWNYLMAASLVVMLPCLIIFFFFQRYFIEGTTVSGIKG